MESMTVEHNLADAGEDAGEHGDPGTPERLFREFIEFFASLVGLIGFGLGFLPDSTAAEKFLVVAAAIALSWMIVLAVRLVPKGRPAAWLAISGGVAITCLSALSVLAEGAPSAPAAAETPLSGRPAASTSHAPATTHNRGQETSAPTLTGVLPSTQADYSLDYSRHAFAMPGDNCQYSNTDNASYVTFTQEVPQVTVTDDLGGDMEISCSWDAATLVFSGQVARVVGSPDPAQCAAAITTDPISGSEPFGQLQPGMEFCLIAGSGNAPGPLVLVTLKSISGSPSFGMSWTATAWHMPSKS
jgi:hypothetical protein